MSEDPKMIIRPNNLRAKISDGNTTDAGFSVDPDAVARAEKFVEETGLDYRAVALDDLEEMKSYFESLNQTESPLFPLALPKIHQIAHDLGGQAGAFGYHFLTEIAQSLSNFTRTLTTANAKQIAIIKVHMDVLQMAIAKDIKLHESAQSDELKQNLALAITRFS